MQYRSHMFRIAYQQIHFLRDSHAGLLELGTACLGQQVPLIISLAGIPSTHLRVMEEQISASLKEGLQRRITPTYQ